jgi:chromosome partitioning protein
MKTRSRMSKIIALANIKGGPGKTTCSIGLAGAFAEAGRRVLAIDLDGQANLTKFFLTIVPRPTIYDVLVDQSPIAPAIQATRIQNIDVASADSRLFNLGGVLHDQPDQAVRLDTALQERQGQRHPYDIVLLDCPPQPGLNTTNALVAAQAALIPIEPAQFSVDGLWEVVEFIAEARKLNPRLAIDGVLINKHHARRTLEQTYIDTLQRSSNVRVLDVRIKDSAEIQKSISAGIPITHYLPRSDHADAFRQVAQIIDPSLVREPSTHAYAKD